MKTVVVLGACAVVASFAADAGTNPAGRPTGLDRAIPAVPATPAVPPTAPGGSATPAVPATPAKPPVKPPKDE